MLDDLGTIILAWRPDLLVHDPAEVTGAVAAELAGIAHVEHSFGVLRPLELRRLATEAMADVSARLGVRNPGVGGLGGELYLDICPPGIQLAEVADIERVQPLRPMGFDDAPGSTMPAWVGDLPPRPTVYVTMGTEFNRRPEVFRSILAGLAPEPINVIVTVGASGDPAQLGPQPDNVRVERFVPQSMFLPRCSAFVAHGGSGALMGAVLHGVPMLAIPQGADQFLNAARVVEVGLGLRLLPDELNGAAVRDATLALIEDPRFVGVARSQRAAIDAMPPPEAVVPILDALVRHAA
jgi:UDP:flavonoid glycosyltransferase YjiC (YdhE family)